MYYTVLYCTVLYCTVLYCAVLYYTVLYYTIQVGGPLEKVPRPICASRCHSAPPFAFLVERRPSDAHTPSTHIATTRLGFPRHFAADSREASGRRRAGRGMRSRGAVGCARRCTRTDFRAIRPQTRSTSEGASPRRCGHAPSATCGFCTADETRGG